ncbi:bifunctional dTDP-4-dehydrorhamnose 3,5-epimerase family protein/NAD(P)-dependent oxidoreductase [Marihabitans asiaticum]|uniref:dTDP-4-dehydrorhamnose reductase n=1 Tax=Marihabitans asiaticum TaxID=415218 RepID=A0A560W8F8_9MICO|nr:bifunctional dTDP-4-dehydrorhamnose 3,5-epimerase family protein/NAD(P)-dependent oxidoreductase [Marihabitans asiaticum]TWD13914.1 dTDP-4-dehydrorhamnose 3,5-epimerase [Marihabitans asiaticum]
MAELAARTTAIPGLLVLALPVHGDARGWFKEAWQREKMTALGLPDFGPVQSNISYNASRGATRGIHAEPWDKLVTVATGSVFGAWVDLRKGETFGATVSVEIGPDTAVFVPRGVGNSYQALEDGTAYTYLVNDHWRPGITYPALALDDPDAAIDWPIPLTEAEISAKDQANPRLGEVTPFAADPPSIVVLGAGGQVGQVLLRALPGAKGVTRAELDLTSPQALAEYDWSSVDVVINAAAMTAVDAAETPQGRREAWAANATGPAALAALAVEHDLTLVHFSSDYVFDGTAEVHDEGEGVAPLGVYGQSKAAGDLAVTVAPRHYVLRTSWVIGEGGNFVSTMARLAREGVSPRVVDDQVGRLSFADDLAGAVAHLLNVGAPYGVYGCTCSGEPMSWADIAREVFVASGRSADDVTGVSTAEYTAGASTPVSPRPARSTLSLERLEATGWQARDQREALAAYLRD